eukprot:CAMPEP_0194276828 /NCGR_PEP_ID=MMETSP0169-20130528/9312_1 /TAXON_ID=218684 /ORGANISM="Corethron pennatum, Strain L29A3" /LENGTH=59 /DNA_ID=CAMNT_0039020633 /DNA_START=143 /DNA_END=319 /DNA_ORIENTATION=-
MEHRGWHTGRAGTRDGVAGPSSQRTRHVPSGHCLRETATESAGMYRTSAGNAADGPPRR